MPIAITSIQNKQQLEVAVSGPAPAARMFIVSGTGDVSLFASAPPGAPANAKETYDDDQTRAFYRQLLDDLRATPGVASAGFISQLPLAAFGFNGPFFLEGGAQWPRGQTPIVEYRVASPGYFEALGIPIVRGRTLSESDVETSTPSVWINDAMARRYWPDADPVGRRISLGMDRQSVWREIAGIVGDVRSRRLNDVATPEVYVAHARYLPAASPV